MSSVISVRGSPASEAIINRIANCEGVDPLDLPPLYEAVDPDALDTLVEPAAGSESDFRVTFSYYGYEVTVNGEGVVHIDEAATPSRTTV